MQTLKWLFNPKGSHDTENGGPVFIFAASWRTGSTLLQRIVNASGEIFIWGEPTFLPEAAKLFSRVDGHFNKSQWNRKSGRRPGVGKWVPIISPQPERAKTAMRAFFETLYQEETRRFGARRWGFKEVRANATAHMKLLGSLWPNAKFLFLVRDPYDMYRSVKGKPFHANFESPMVPVKIWRDNVNAFLSDTNAGAALLIHYEQLAAVKRGDDGLLHRIADYLGTHFNDKMYIELETRVDPSGAKLELAADEVAAITQIAGEPAQRLGYRLR
jgi:hypothetical protein